MMETRHLLDGSERPREHQRTRGSGVNWSPIESQGPNPRSRNCASVFGTLSAMGIVVGLSTLAALASHQSQNAAPSFRDLRKPGGSMMLAGGGIVTSEIRRQFIELAGGAQAKIVIVPAIDPTPEKEQSMLAPWRSMGVPSVSILHAADRSVADSKDFCSRLSDATGIWFGGGYQSLLVQRYVDTQFQKCLHEILNRGGVVGGCSAGAALMSRVMILEGDTVPVEAKGFDLLDGVIVDQHFLARNRLWRLEQMLDAHPTCIGLGVDEATAVVIDSKSRRMHAVGESYVFVCLPSSKSSSRRIEILKPNDDVSLAELSAAHREFVPPGGY